MSPLLKALSGHPARRERAGDWVGLLLATLVLTSVTTLLGR